MTAPYEILQGDSLAVLRTLENDSVDCCITSPPYWGLRDYGVAGQIGLEETPDEFVAKLVAVFAEVRRVLKPDGTCWVNLGDSYANDGKWGGSSGGKHVTALHGDSGVGRQKNKSGLKPKDLCGIPWRVAFALQADGWWLRQDIIWAKPNPMPESTKDRCTKAHEYLFLLTKSARYFYDADAVAEPATCDRVRGPALHRDTVSTNGNGGLSRREKGETRNKRSVWTMATMATPEAHFATFPLELPETCLLAGSRPGGKHCDCAEVIETPTGAVEASDPSMTVGRAGMSRVRGSNEGTRPITRFEQRQYAEQMRASPHCVEMAVECGAAFAHYIRTDKSGARPLPPEILSAWLLNGYLKSARRECDCPIQPAGIILDPFNGAGTTGLAALKNGRRYIGIELNPAYVEITHQRFQKYMPLLAVNS